MLRQHWLRLENAFLDCAIWIICKWIHPWCILTFDAHDFQAQQDLIILRNSLGDQVIQDSIQDPILKLALHGWEICPTNSQVIQCFLCARKVGVWGTRLNAVTEHRWYCPWIEGEPGWKITLDLLSKRGIKRKEIQDWKSLDVYKLLDSVMPL